MTHPFEIREPDRKQLYAVAVLAKKFFPYTHLSFTDVEARVKKDLKYLVARAGGQTIGYVDFSIAAGGEAKTGKIWGLAVVEEWRGKGVGRALLSRAVGEIRKAGAERIEMLTTTDNAAALRLYEKFGFKYAGHYEKTLPGKEVIIMAKDSKHKT
ncbi:MAG: GNAT family N-acetyltransferase [Candidatus Micrarchaeota archaeon]|nr:GNAT family N-acetyltransferase [Candidatus Micrarchaeota archaeon]